MDYATKEVLVRTCQDDERNFCIVEADTDPGTPAGRETPRPMALPC